MKMIRRIMTGTLAATLPVGAVLGAVATAASPRTITASVVPANGKPYARPGTFVGQSGLSNRAYVSRTRGFALWTGRGVTYPACTTKTGRSWFICGPHLHVNAADAPDVVTQVGAHGHEYFTYGGPGGAESIVVSTNERTWHRAYMPGVPEAVSADASGKLFAFVVAGGSLSKWTSNNGGRTWTKA